MSARTSLDHLSSWYYHEVMADGMTVGDHLDTINRRLTALEELLVTARGYVTATGVSRTDLSFAVFDLLPIGETSREELISAFGNRVDRLVIHPCGAIEPGPITVGSAHRCEAPKGHGGEHEW